MSDPAVGMWVMRVSDGSAGRRDRRPAPRAPAPTPPGSAPPATHLGPRISSGTNVPTRPVDRGRSRGTHMLRFVPGVAGAAQMYVMRGSSGWNPVLLGRLREPWREVIACRTAGTQIEKIDGS